jgi:hypothetical protein
VADGLSALLQNEVDDGGISPIKVCRNAPGISHLMFADDTMLFFRATEEQAIRVKDVLEVYEKGTGQLINPAKCSIMFSTVCTQEAQDMVRTSLQVVQRAFEDKYLCLPTPEGKFESLQARLSKWLIDLGDSTLSQSAREILIKAIAQANPTYVMGVFKLPASVCDDLGQLIRNYWWGSEKGKRKCIGSGGQGYYAPNHREVWVSEICVCLIKLFWHVKLGASLTFRTVFVPEFSGLGTTVTVN